MAGKTGAATGTTYDMKRIPVYFGKIKRRVRKEDGTRETQLKDAIILPTRRVADALNLTPATDAQMENSYQITVSGGGKETIEGIIPGSKGAGSIRVPLEGQKTPKGYQKYVSVPVPASASIKQIRQFASKYPKIKTFSSPGGRSYGVVTATN